MKYDSMSTEMLIEIRELKLRIHKKFTDQPNRYKQYRGRHLTEANRIAKIIAYREDNL